MRTKANALLVHDEEGLVAELKPLLQLQGFTVLKVRTCAEAEAALGGVKPALIFTSTQLTDGTWADVTALAERQHPSVPVIVVSRFVDLPLYTEVLERGATDFIVPPFNKADLAWVVGSALLNGPEIPSASPYRTTGARLEVTQHAQNYASAGPRAANAQAGR